MDNLAHGLTGWALSEAGLRRKTGLATATLVIAANLPDVDALGLLFGENLAWRRGWTHGPLALVLLPLLLAGAMVAFDRWQARRGTRPAARDPVRPLWLLALAYVGILSHPLLDFLNTYGIRCLMPFSERWFYGDALFIIDVWLWSALALGIWLARRRRKAGTDGVARPAVAALAAVALYAGAMGAGGVAAGPVVARAAAEAGLPAPERVVANPVPVDPFRRRVVFAAGDAYGFGTLHWLPRPRVDFLPGLVPTNMDDPAIARAAEADKGVRDFLYWSRLPFAAIERRNGAAHVTIGDARYNEAPAGRFSVGAVVPE